MISQTLPSTNFLGRPSGNFMDTNHKNIDLKLNSDESILLYNHEIYHLHKYDCKIYQRYKKKNINSQT